MVKTVKAILIILIITVLFVSGCGANQSAQQSSGQSQTAESSNQQTASNEASTEIKTIGVIQLVEHPALDAAREGFMDGLKQAGFTEDKVKIDVKNAQGDFATAQNIAEGFKDENVDLIYAIATPAVQAAYNVTKDIPIVFAAVTDPVSAKVVESLDKPNTNVTGVSDMTPVEEQLKLLKQILPDAKNVGIMYNAGEINSVVQVDMAKKAAPALGLNLVEATVSTSGEVSQAAQSLVGRVDAIYIPTDNTIASSIQAVAKVANANKIPVIASEEGMVSGGALITKGINYYNLGVDAGKIAAEILNGKKPADIPVMLPQNMDIVVNKTTMGILGIKLPDDILKESKTVE
ncbi:ABC transporter substrate-binding protein [Calorimonas adulescens]|uniref:ABC transporter substrate-binding protein n=1 Tax=Calorimonas adulescens TaxID=2606906 RepID=A0A5D8QHW4_9THEO|nr:ABC transporter substrate-binding protein [Calorimonas adulescens]TZE82888.1 ABC transporter substrate-binding protein [Calorimonas adulescens]